ncbi:MAG TPA: amidohydrolase family protein [Candidatus Binataceae bacterium]|nr:amidohydrolase family protein [Candidatus Binataceae bacterium]
MPSGADLSGRFDEAWLAQHHEEIIEPQLPIVDPHHHMWSRAGSVYLFPELMADLSSGHNIRATVFEECGSMYRADGPAELRSIGETEFVTGVSAMSASGGFGPSRACAAMVGNVNLLLGARVERILATHVSVSGGRFRAIRFSTAWDADERVHKTVPRPKLLAEPNFREGYRYLAKFGLTFDAWVYHPQLSEVADLASSFPQTPIVLNHFGSPILGGPNAGRTDEVFAEWRAGMTALASHPNVFVKLGALPVRRPKTVGQSAAAPLTSEEIAGAWRPYFEVCVEKFGAGRCMFESNFPVQKRFCSYAVFWNACKHLARGASAAEKSELFAGTAARAYRLAAELI